jgi:alpha-galactosidase
MIKIDFIGHAAIEADTYYDPSVHTGMQAFRKGMEFLVDQLDGKMLVYAAISPSLATGRYVHMRRIACDAFKNISETAYTLNATSLGWWQNKVYDFTDADHVVFAGATPGENRARLTSAIVTGTVITGDDYSEYSSASGTAQQLLQNPGVLEAAQLPNGFVPVDHHTGDTPSSLFVHNSGRYTYIAVVNYSKEAGAFEAGWDQLGLTKGEYRCKE